MELGLRYLGQEVWVPLNTPWHFDDPEMVKKHQGHLAVDTYTELVSAITEDLHVELSRDEMRIKLAQLIITLQYEVESLR